ncbi:hypothetical protein V8P55_02080 [Acinetobacter baumannii]
MYNELKLYFEIAENIYEEIFGYDDEFLILDQVKDLDKIMAEVVKQAAKENIKLKYTNLNFEYYLNVPITERALKIDLSLFCMLKRRDEMIPWLVQFIKSISISNFKVKV